MKFAQLADSLERSPVIAAINDTKWDAALASPVEVLFYLKANIFTVAEKIKLAHEAGKGIFIHIDLADGIGKDKTGVEYLKSCGVDGVISTRGQLIRAAKDCGLLTVQRFFALDSQGLSGISETLEQIGPDFMEIMPGVAYKAISHVATGKIPVIAGGLIETKAEVLAAIGGGALAVSTGTPALWTI